MAFCPKCGKKGIKGRFCKDCAGNKLDLGFKDIVVKKCVDCNRFMIRSSWKEFEDADEGIVAAAIGRIRNPGKVGLDIVPRHKEIMNKPGLKQEIELEIEASGQDFIIPAFIDFTYCDKCRKAGSDYFEGTLQLRGADDKLADYVKADIAAHANEGVHVAKATGRGGNLDFKLTSAKYMRALGKRLKQRFNGELTETSKLFSKDKQTGKEIHRVTVLFRMRGYKVGDVVESRGRKVKIKTVGKRVSGVDTETGKKVFVE
jgi:NMD protein affecting ribosome stability and mRNA decay